jgi:hypothetical protein
MSGSTKESSPALIQPIVALSHAFDHISLDQLTVREKEGSTEALIGQNKLVGIAIVGAYVRLSAGEGNLCDDLNVHTMTADIFNEIAWRRQDHE